MNTPVRRLAAVLMLGFAILIVDVTYIQGVEGPEYRDDPRNQRVLTERAGQERGPILSRENMVLARSAALPGETDAFARSYPFGPLYAHVVGYSSALFGDSGLEATRSDVLRSGRTGTITGILERLAGRDVSARGLRLTLSHPVQEAAAAALGDQTGAVVALDPFTGAVLAMYSSPSFDPAALLGLDPTAGDALEADPALPLLNRATDERYPPGSAFKTVTAAAALETGAANPDSLFADPVELELPGSTATISNFGGAPCGDGQAVTLRRAFVRSCNTVFGQLGMDMGALALVGIAEAFGFNDEVPLELEPLASVTPEVEALEGDLPALAQNAIGERDIRATALGMALVAAAVANDGVIMTPYLVQETFTRELEIDERTQPAIWQRAIGPGSAAELAALMEAAVEFGTGRNAAISGTRVAAKTGTAENPAGDPHVWFVGFAPVEGPEIAVAVVVEDGGNAGAAGTGGTVAAPIGRAVMEAWLASNKTSPPLQSPE